VASGIGGTRKGAGIKCLHSQWAHFKSYSQNPIGKVVDEEVDSHIRACPSPCVRRREDGMWIPNV
jgi:hypothetical protein